LDDDNKELRQRYRIKLHLLLKVLGQKIWAKRALEAENFMELNVLAGIAYRKMIEGRPERHAETKRRFEMLGFDVTQAQEEIQGDIKDRIMRNAKNN